MASSASRARNRGGRRLTVGPWLLLAGLILPLSLDTFAVAAALGVAELPRSERLRTILVLAVFETAMPVVGLLLGDAAAGITRRGSRFIAGAGLVAFGLWTLFRPEEDEDRRARALARARGWALFGLGAAISVDELAVGAGFGLLRLPIAPAIALIAVQALVAGQLGLLIGARAGEAVRQGSEKLAGLVLIAIGAGLALLPLR